MAVKILTVDQSQVLSEFIQHLINNEYAIGDGVYRGPMLEKLLGQWKGGYLATDEELADSVAHIYFQSEMQLRRGERG